MPKIFDMAHTPPYNSVVNPKTAISPQKTDMQNRPNNVTVLGAGSWGTALAILLAENGHNVELWDRNRDIISGIQYNHINPKYLPDTTIPENIAPKYRISDAITSATDWIVIAVASDGVRPVIEEASGYIQPECALIGATKGLDSQTGGTISDIVSEVLISTPHRGYVALSGPNLAHEVVKKFPSAAVAASSDLILAREAQELLGSPIRFRVYAANDVHGVELAGALKNVLAIGAGISDGLGFGDNAKAALMTRGLAEIITLGVAAGASAQTFLGLAGVGDLMATATSKLSRNYRVGFGLAKEQSMEIILSQIGQVAEGVSTAKATQILSSKFHVAIPLLATIHDVIHCGKSARYAVAELMSRPFKDEF